MSSSQLLDSTAVYANREGQLTPSQRSAYVSVTTSGKGGWLIIAICALILLAVAYFFGQQLADVQGAAQVLVCGGAFAVLILVVVFVNRLYSIPARRRAASAHVEGGQGMVEFEHSRYTPILNGKPLRSIFNDESRLLPGSYQFYILSGTNWLVSAEKLADAQQGTAAPYDAQDVIARMPEPLREHYAPLAEIATQYFNETEGGSFDRAELSAALAQAIGFERDDLAANRQGKLSPRQIDLLKGARASNIRWGVVFIAIGIIAAVAVIMKDKTLDVQGVGAILLFFCGVGVVLVFLGWRSRTDARRGVVGVVEGSVSKHAHSSSGRGASSTTYYYDVGDQHIKVSHAGYEAMIEHVKCRVYYTPVTKRLMSVELVG